MILLFCETFYDRICLSCICSYRENRARRRLERERSRKGVRWAEEGKVAMRRGKERGMRWDLLPLIALFVLLPLVVRMQLMDNLLKEYPWFPGDGQRGDFFLYWKSRFLQVLAVWMLLILADRRLIRRKESGCGKRFLPLAGYGLLAVLSTVFSVDRELSVYGMADQCETIGTLLCYPLAAYYGYCVVEDEKDVKIAVAALAAGGALQCLLGISQILGHSFWETAAGRALIIPEGIDAGQVIFNFAQEEMHSVYMALYNPNYAGVYIVLLLPVFIAFFFLAEKKIWKVFGALFLALFLWCLIETGSKTGLGIVLLGGLAASFFAGTSLKKRLLCLGAAFCGVILVMTGYDFLTGHKVSRYFTEAFREREAAYLLENIRTEKEYVNIRFGGEELYFRLDDDGNVLLEDGKGERMEKKEPSEEGIYPANGTDDPMRFHAETRNGVPYLVTEYQGIAWYFTDRTEDGGYAYITPYGKADGITEAKSSFPAQWDSLFTYRGYIWGRTIPLLGKSLFWGSGPNTFAVVFPQNDYLTRAKLKEGFFREILTKPHNMYLQAALETGVVSLLLLLAFWGRYLIESFRLYRKKEGRDGVGLTGLAIFAGTAGYLLAGITNDSIVAAAPIFWGMAGVGMAVNQLVQPKQTASRQISGIDKRKRRRKE